VISDPNVRKKIVSWEQDTCKDPASLFKEMVISRAKVAHLGGFSSYFDYTSQSKMMDTRSVPCFLKGMKAQVTAQTNTLIESALGEKMQALNYDFTIKDLRLGLRPGKTIRDYQLHNPEVQINWGGVSCTCS
jgi:Zn-dependent oligopeptidase